MRFLGLEWAHAKTQRRKGGRRGCPCLLVLASLRLERSGREHFICHPFWSRRGQAGEAKPRSRKAAKGTGRKKEEPAIRAVLSFLRLPCSRVLCRGSRDSWALCDSWFRDLRFLDHEWHEGFEWAHADNRPSTERVLCSNELAVLNACAG